MVRVTLPDLQPGNGYLFRSSGRSGGLSFAVRLLTAACANEKGRRDKPRRPFFVRNPWAGIRRPCRPQARTRSVLCLVDQLVGADPWHHRAEPRANFLDRVLVVHAPRRLELGESSLV